MWDVVPENKLRYCTSKVPLRDIVPRVLTLFLVWQLMTLIFFSATFGSVSLLSDAGDSSTSSLITPTVEQEVLILVSMIEEQLQDLEVSVTEVGLSSSLLENR